MITAKMRDLQATYVAIHAEVLLDTRRFLAVGNSWSQLDSATLKAVREYFRWHKLCFGIHNHAADEHFFPIFVRRMPELQLESVLDARNAERREIGQMLEGIDALFTTDLQKLSKALEDYQAYVEKHFDEEETKLMVPIVNKLTRELAIEIEKEFQKELSPDERNTMFAWALDGMDERTKAKFFKEKTPFFVPYMYRWFMKPKFERRVAVFRRFGM